MLHVHILWLPIYSFNVLLLLFSLIMHNFSVFLFHSSRNAGFSDCVVVSREVHTFFSTYLLSAISVLGQP